MHKLSCSIDVTKIKKARLRKVEYTTQEGELVTKMMLDFDVVPLKEMKKLKEGETYEMWKTHFIAEQTTKAERESGYKGAILGDGLYFKGKERAPQPAPEAPAYVPPAYDYPTEEINPEDIPF